MRRLVCVPGTLAAAIGGRSTSLDAMIAKTFFIVKIFRAQSTNYLRRKKVFVIMGLNGDPKRDIGGRRGPRVRW
jgi:hypothetical protein